MKLSDFSQVAALKDDLTHVRLLMSSGGVSLLPNGGGGKSYWWATPEHVSRQPLYTDLLVILAYHEKRLLDELSQLGVETDK